MCVCVCVHDTGACVVVVQAGVQLVVAQREVFGADGTTTLGG